VAQAATFADTQAGYALRHNLPGEFFSSGFSAAVFESNERPGEFTIAIRGTEPVAGLINDLLVGDGLGVALSGRAREQAIAAFRYYKQLTTGKDDPVHYSSSELLMLAALRTGSPVGVRTTAAYLQLLVQVAGEKGLGIIPAGAAVNLSGHSLGGHVAVLLSEMIPDSAVSHVYTYNAPGIGGIAAEIASWFGAPASVPRSKITNIIAEGGISIAAGLGEVRGDLVNVAIESVPGIDIGNHSIVKLSDSMALLEALTEIDQNLTVEQFNQLVDAISLRPDDTLERLLFVIEKAIRGSTATPVAPNDKEAYWTRVLQLGSSVPAGAIRIVPLDDGADAILQAALGNSAESLAYRYALRELIPVAVVGVDYSARYTNGELDVYNESTGSVPFCRHTWYCSGVKDSRHSASVFGSVLVSSTASSPFAGPGPGPR